MSKRSWLRALCVVAALASSATFAATPAPPAALDSESALQQVQARKVEAYREVLARFDQAMQAAPDDVALHVARCDFINQFTDDEYGDWVESAPDDFEACSTKLHERWPKAPEAQLFALEQTWGEETVEEGEKLLDGADTWPAALRARMLAYLSQAHANEDNDARANELAAQAVALGDYTRVAAAVTHFASRGEHADAARLLQKAPPAEHAWAAGQRIIAALELPDARHALRELRRYAKADFEVDATVAARAYLHAGDIAAARKALAGDEASTSDGKQVHFDVALAALDFPAAAALVDVTDMEDLTANLQRFAMLAQRAPMTLFTAPMLLMALTLVGIAAALALLPGLLLLPVHYRGLVRRLRGKPAVALFDSVGLRQAWIGAACFIAVPTLVAVAIEPGSAAALVDGDLTGSPAALFRGMLWGTLACLLCIVPVVRGMDRRQLMGDRAALRASWGVLLSWAALFGLAILLVAVNQKTGNTTTSPHIETMRVLAAGGMETGGPWLTLLLMAVLVPILEEIVFRGLILGGLTRHISFGWANTLQAALFAVIHDDPPRWAYYFALGLLAGWLVKKTRSLGPAIALHALNNALATAMRVF